MPPLCYPALNQALPRGPFRWQAAWQAALPAPPWNRHELPDGFTGRSRRWVNKDVGDRSRSASVIHGPFLPLSQRLLWSWRVLLCEASFFLGWQTWLVEATPAGLSGR